MGGKRKNSGSFCKPDESASKSKSGVYSDDCDSQEELDGPDSSVLKWSSTNNGVRYSARVMEKQEKLRRESSPAKQIVTDSNCQTALSSSISPPSQGWKVGMKADEGFGHISSDQGQHFPSSSTGLSSIHSAITITSSGGAGILEEKQRKKRNWELWSQDDKQLFFEALNDFGKDFDAIQNHLASKLRTKNKLGHSTSAAVPGNQFIPKNKDQVRHFYYRTWNKISKFLTFPKDMKKAFQELYGLVNYGELRKKQRVLNMKTAAKLSELVEKGTTTIKVRGKTLRIKTPVCRALKRLNRLEDVEHVRVPCKVSLELNAKDGRAWAAVQRVSHNPRVKVHVPLQRTLASVISYFEDRWKSPTDKLKEQLLHTFGRRTVPRLRFIPTATKDMNLPIFKVSEVTSSAKLSLRSFTEKVLKEFDKTTDSSTKNKKKNVAFIPDDCVTETESDADPIDALTPTTTSTILKNANKSLNIDTPETVVAGLSSQSDKVLLSPELQKPSSSDPFFADDNFMPTHNETSTTADTCCACPPSSSKGDEDFLSHVWDDDTIRKGWTVEDAGTMTCGELYLLLGQSDTLCFEYYWDTGESTLTSNEVIKLMDRLVEVARLLKKRKTLSRSKSPWPISCAKCGHKPELAGNALRSPSIHSRTQQLGPHPTSEETFRLLSAGFQVQQQSTYTRTSELNPHLIKRINVNTNKKDKEASDRKLHESLISSRNEDNDPNFGTFRRPIYIVPKDIASASITLPPKPFLDLPKGNRRIGRPTLKRVVIPRVLPLRPKTSDTGGSMYTHSITVPTAVKLPVMHTPAAQNISLNQSGLPVKSKDGQEINLLNCLTPPAPGPSKPNFTDLGSVQPDSCITVGSNEFEYLLKIGRSDKLSTDPENSFSLSSFMEISLPESSRLEATACLNSQKFMNETVEQSSCSLGLSNFLDTCETQQGVNEPSLDTPMKVMPVSSLSPHRKSLESRPSLSGVPWMTSTNTNDPSEISLTSLLGTFDEAVQNNPALPELSSDVNFQSVVGEGSPNFLTKYSERATKLGNNNKKVQDET